jgi:hypothetical protein
MDSWTGERKGSRVVEEPLYKNYNERYVFKIDKLLQVVCRVGIVTVGKLVAELVLPNAAIESPDGELAQMEYVAK